MLLRGGGAGRGASNSGYRVRGADFIDFVTRSRRYFFCCPGRMLSNFVLKNGNYRGFGARCKNAHFTSLESGWRYRRKTAIDVVEKLGTGNLYDRSVAASSFATDWWQADDGRLPGETGDVSVFVIDFADGCRFFGYTGSLVFDRVVELVTKRGPYSANEFVSGHAAEVPYVVKCIASGLGRNEARLLRDLLVTVAPARSPGAGRSVVPSENCWLAEDEPRGESLPFSAFGSLGLDLSLGSRFTHDLP